MYMNIFVVLNPAVRCDKHTDIDKDRNLKRHRLTSKKSVNYPIISATEDLRS